MKKKTVRFLLEIIFSLHRLIQKKYCIEKNKLKKNREQMKRQF